MLLDLFPTEVSRVMQGKRELYQCASSRKRVSRTVILDDSRTFRTDTQVDDQPCADAQAAFEQAFLRRSSRRMPDEDRPVIRGADLFCGCGGLSLGVEEACLAIGHRFEVLLAVDNTPSILEVYKANFSPKQACESDVRVILDGRPGARPTPAERTLLEDLGEIDILLAGPPCQGHSDLNNHTRRKDKRNRLYERVGRLAEIARPKHVLVENVPAIVHSRDRALSDTTDLLVRCGYEVDTNVVDLSEIGVPQRRKRHILVASRNGPVSIEDVMEKHRVSQVRDVEWAIGDLEQEGVGDILSRPSKHNQANLRRIDYLFEHGLYNLPNELRPPCHQDGKHSYKSMYGRLRYDEPAQTITSGYGSPGQGRFIHPTQHRTLTPHEAARLQFFPDFFDFASVRRRTVLANAIGNAVPMKLSYIFCLEFFA